MVLALGTVYGATPWTAPRQSAYPGSMMGGYAYGGGQQAPLSNYAGGMMGAYGGMMGGYGASTGGYRGMMAGYGGVMGQYYGQAGGATAGGGMVAIVNYGFYPAILTVAQGTTVTWVNMDLVQHTVTSGSEQAPTGLFDSQELSHMQSFSYTFNTPGTYAYFCDIHPSMTGTIIVSA